VRNAYDVDIGENARSSKAMRAPHRDEQSTCRDSERDKALSGSMVRGDRPTSAPRRPGWGRAWEGRPFCPEHCGFLGSQRSSDRCWCAPRLGVTEKRRDPRWLKRRPRYRTRPTRSHKWPGAQRSCSQEPASAAGYPRGCASGTFFKNDSQGARPIMGENWLRPPAGFGFCFSQAQSA